MQVATIRDADKRLGLGKRKILVTQGGNIIEYYNLDFDEGGDNSDHVNLYGPTDESKAQTSLRAVIDVRSVVGIYIR